MPLHSVTIHVSSEADAGYISDILFELGALSVTVSDKNRNTPDERSIFGEPPASGLVHDTPPSPQKYWNESTITSLYPLSCDIEKLVMLLATDFDLPTTPSFIQTDIFDEKQPEHWIKEFQQYFKPIVIGRIRISYPWHPRDANYHDIRLDPGLAFGTGAHQTTQLCLEWLHTAIKRDTTILDYGTGTGILSIAAVMLSHNSTSVTAVDIDPLAVRVARSNAMENDVDERITFFENKDEPNAQYDLVIANILAGPLKELAQLLVSRMKPQAKIALSGILSSQAVDVMDCYSRLGVAMEEAAIKDGWSLLSGTKS